MNKIYFIISMIILAGIAVFAMINTDIVTVHLFWITDIKASVAVIIICSVFLGALLMSLIDLGRHIRVWQEVKKLKSSLKTAEEELKALRSSAGKPAVAQDADSAPKQP